MLRTSTRTIRTGLVVAVVCGLLAVAQRNADAKCSKNKQVDAGGGKMKSEPRIGKPEKTFKARVLTSTKRFPTYATSVNAYISKVKKLHQTKFYEDKKKKEWKIYFIAFFKAPHDDMEVSIRLWDVSSGVKQHLSSFEQYLERCSTSYASDMILRRADFGVNKEIMITVEDSRRHTVLASGKIKIIGEAEKFKGKVVFNDDDDDTGKAGDDDEADDDDDDDDDPPPAVAEKDPDVEEWKEEEPLDLNDPDLDKPPSLDPRTEMEPERPPEQRKARGCGCRAGGSGDTAGGLLVMMLVVGLLRRPRRSRRSKR